MQFDREKFDGNLIRSYTRGKLHVNDSILTAPAIISTTAITADWTPPAIDQLTTEHFADALRDNPEVILFGSGAMQIFPPPRLMTDIMRQGVGFEVMDTAAACRTYNVLAADQRRVVAALLLD